jgi:ubiquinone/menaquinone biosynthesis methyltransferase
MNKPVDDIYDAAYLQQLFNEMQGTYERVSTLCSFGFNWRWRKQLISRLNLEAGMTVCDLMAGTGEIWKYVLPRIGQQGEIVALDFSEAMIHEAEKRKHRLKNATIHVLRDDVLYNQLPTASVDAVVCIYGVKTLSPDDEECFVCEIKRLLKPGGVFGLVEISVPRWTLLRFFYLFYLHFVIPTIGKLALGNPDNYRMLTAYMVRFRNCDRLHNAFVEQGFDVCPHSFFFGCATALTGKLPQ